MSYTMLVFSAYLLSSFGVECGGWVVLVGGVSLLVSQFNFLFYQYMLISEWVGLDEMSLIMIMLSIVVMMVSLVSSFKDIKMKKGVGFMNSISAVEMVVLISLGSMLFFSVCSMMDFYFFFEFSLIPTFLLILKWGYQPERLQAGMYMMMYTVSASLPLLVGMLVMSWKMGSDNMLLTKMNSMSFVFYFDWVWVFVCMGFLVKLPIYSVHGWLPKAHVEAPLSGSMLLAGVLLKFGGYGVVRFIWFTETYMMKIILFLVVFSLWGGVITSCVCICQSDLKSLIAYSSIGHMSMSIGGVLSFYSLGKMACVCFFFAHGLCSPMLFSLAASSYDFVKSRNVLISKGVLRSFPIFSTFWFIFCVINMGFPPSLNFFSEIFCVSSMIWLSYILSFSVGLMCFLAGCYCLVLYSLVSHGSLSDLCRSTYSISSRYLFCFVFLSVLLMLMFMMMDLCFV
uniref:NADH-ubiquinone oxidoreductase chain 4 n=1 Tax=Dosinia japonica TaxID=368946 RepID=A0A2U8JF83_9BIVA|nr:NADH dehydrogenase subunit 4 [Dosinia japonica]AWK60550.1 NADH dehydrogenase subunit 4 [Dosinia japonica]